MTYVCTPEEFLAAGPLGRRKLVLAQIEATPDAHDQDVWIEQGVTCGTTACVAGWTCLLAGDRPLGRLMISDVVTAEGVEEPVPSRAAELLGLDDEVDYLFTAENEDAVEWLREHVA